MEKSGILNKLVKAFDPKKPAPLPLPDDGGSNMPNQSLDQTIPLPTHTPNFIRLSLIRNVKEGDYNATIQALQVIKLTEIDAEKVIPEALKQGHDYEVEERIIKAGFENSNLQGGTLIGSEQLASFRPMSRMEVEDISKFIEAGPMDEMDKQLIPLSQVLQGAEYKIVKAGEVPGEGVRALIIVKEKKEQLVQIEEVISTVQIPEVQQQEPKEFDISSSPFLKGPGKYWSNN